MDVIRSRQNARVKVLRQHAQGREHDSLGLAEGWHLVEEALRAGLRLEQVFVAEDALVRWQEFASGAGADLPEAWVLTRDVFVSAVNSPSPQGVAALVERPAVPPLLQLLQVPRPLLVVLDGVQDPGNVGTIVRSALAFGATALLALPGTAEPFADKALRASAGAAFRLPVYAGEWRVFAAEVRELALPVVATVPRDGVSPAEFDWSRGAALVMGSEGAGISQALLEEADARVTIPMPGDSESLNAAVAAGILLYEAAR